VVAPTGRLAASRIDANWTPGDTLYDPDRAGDVAAATGTNASFLFAEQSGDQQTTFAITYDHTAGPTLVDPSGERMIGVASGLEPTMPRTAPAPTQEPARSRLASMLAHSRSQDREDTLDHELLEVLPAAERARLHRLRALDIPVDPTPEESSEGVSTAELEVQTPDGRLTTLRELFDEPEQFARSSLESIEYSLAVAAEMRVVTVCVDHPNELVNLVCVQFSNDLIENDRRIGNVRIVESAGKPLQIDITPSRIQRA
jgi:hypothetical protein